MLESGITYFILVIWAWAYGRGYLLTLNPVFQALVRAPSHERPKSFTSVFWMWRPTPAYHCLNIDIQHHGGDTSHIQALPQESARITADSFPLSSSFTCFSQLICLHSTPGCVILSYICRRSVCVCSHIKGGHKSLLRKNFYIKAIYSPQCSLIADNYELGQLSSCLWRGRYSRIKCSQWWLSATRLLTCWYWVGRACSAVFHIINSAAGKDCILA